MIHAAGRFSPRRSWPRPIWAFARICEGAIGAICNCGPCGPGHRDFPLRGLGAGANRAPHLRPSHPMRQAESVSSGRSSEVEHNLAKVGVEGSNPFARSSFSMKTEQVKRIANARNLLPRPVPRVGEAGGKHKSAFRGVRSRPHGGRLKHAKPRGKADGNVRHNVGCLGTHGTSIFCRSRSDYPGHEFIQL
jgi:hypothetical protein